MTPIERRKPNPFEQTSAAAIPAPRATGLVGRWRSLVTLSLAVLVGACASSTAPTYVEPPVSDASAKVRVVNTRPYAYYADIAIFDSIACFDRANIGTTGGTTKDDARIGMLGEAPPSSSSIERHVRAGEPLVIGPRAVYPTASVTDILHAMMPLAQEQMRARQAGVCKIPTFTPKANEQYEVLIDLSPARCTITPYRLVESNGTVQREMLKVELSQISTYEFDMKCFK
jgi:hypothetical protein